MILVVKNEKWLYKFVVIFGKNKNPLNWLKAFILKGFMCLELTSGLEPPNLLLTKQVLYLLSYVSILNGSIK